MKPLNVVIYLFIYLWFILRYHWYLDYVLIAVVLATIKYSYLMMMMLVMITTVMIVARILSREEGNSQKICFLQTYNF
jgi:hypothetical protein